MMVVTIYIDYFCPVALPFPSPVKAKRKESHFSLSTIAGEPVGSPSAYHSDDGGEVGNHDALTPTCT
jgi:hypothetical protein